MYQALRKEVEGLQDGIIRFTQSLVRTQSLSLCETYVAGMIDNQMRELDYDLVVTDEIGNIVGVILGGDPRFTVVLNSHMDTVQPDPVDGWSIAPYGGEISDGRLTGVGASDCKGGIATQVFAAHVLARSGRGLNGNVVVAATVAEENGCSVGVRHLFQHTLPRIGMTPRFVILGEPTGLKVGYGHDGWARIDIDILGVKEQEVRRAAQKIFDHLSFFCDASGPSSLRRIMAAERPEFTAGKECFRDRIGIVRRLFAGETESGILGWLNDEVVNGIEKDLGVAVETRLHEELQRPYTGKCVNVRAVTQPWFTDLRHPLVGHAREALISAGLEWAPELWALDRLGMGTAGSFITREIGIPTIGFGPGEEAQAHACNESVSLSNLVDGAYGTAAITLGLIGTSLKGLH